ncbi:hypothetical protein K7V76_001996 [Vibrio fluvialis]|nr:hypothetical protein [Vibrio fluvialis]EKO3526469.1 hypothetical protein [Vibrio fluvialis]
MALRKHIQESAFVQFVQRHWNLISILFSCLFVFLLVYGFTVLVGRVPDYIEIDELRYSRVYDWYSDEHVRPLIASALSDGEISLSEYFEIENAISKKGKLIRMAQGDN